MNDDNNNTPVKHFWVNLVERLHQHVQDAQQQLPYNEARIKVLNEQILPAIAAIRLNLLLGLSIRLEPNMHDFGEQHVSNGQFNLGIGSSGLYHIVFETSNNDISNINIGSIQFTNNNNNGVTAAGPLLTNTDGILKGTTTDPLSIKANENGDSIIVSNIIAETIIPESSTPNPSFARYAQLIQEQSNGSRSQRRQAASALASEFPNGAPSAEIIILESRTTGPYNGNLNIKLLQFTNV